jgi:16S rRNA (guanine527-N7)-methyltransferase
MMVVPSPPTEFHAACEAANIALEPDDLQRLEHYLRLLYEANERMNLTGIRDPLEGWTRHIFDSLTLLPWLAAMAEDSESISVIDVGTGGGCPGIPLACVSANVSMTLLDSTRKKTAFLEETAAAIGLSNVRVVTDRAEQAGRDSLHRGQYDVVVSRAVGRLPILLEYTVPLAKEDGLVLSIKGAQAESEVEASKFALHALHAEVVDVVHTPTGRVIVIQKKRKTPGKYPRGVGEPAKSPLG